MSIELVGMVRGPQTLALKGSPTCHSSRTILNKKSLNVVTLPFGSIALILAQRSVNKNMALVYKDLVLNDLGKLVNKDWCLCFVSFRFLFVCLVFGFKSVCLVVSDGHISQQH